MFEQSSLYSAQLGREVALDVFLPDDCRADAPCPVLYLHDGGIYYEDGLHFRDYYAAYRAYLPRAIIVGIEPPAARRARTEELSPYTKSFDPHGADFDTLVRGKGALLAEWIVRDLKPYIDANYPTLPDREHTAVGGFSSGALNAAYCAMTHGGTFSRLLLQSPAFHLWLDELRQTARTTDLSALLSCYLEVGTNDVTRMTTAPEALAAARELHALLLARGVQPDRLRFFTVPGGAHSPASWRWTFPDALRWTFRGV